MTDKTTEQGAFMSATKAIFVKQVKDTYKNIAVLIQFVIFPLVALAMKVFVAGGTIRFPTRYL